MINRTIRIRDKDKGKDNSNDVDIDRYYVEGIDSSSNSAVGIDPFERFVVYSISNEIEWRTMGP